MIGRSRAMTVGKWCNCWVFSIVRRGPRSAGVDTVLDWSSSRAEIVDIARLKHDSVTTTDWWAGWRPRSTIYTSILSSTVSNQVHLYCKNPLGILHKPSQCWTSASSKSVKLKLKKVKLRKVELLMKLHLTATGCHLTYGITHTCYLLPDTSQHTTALPYPDRPVLNLPILEE